MKAYISGQIGRSAIEAGAYLLVYDIDSDSERKYSSSKLDVLFSGAADVVKIEVESESVVKKRLRTKYEQDRALLLSLLLLDSNEDFDVAKEAAEALEELFQKEAVEAFVRNILFSDEMADRGDLKNALILAKEKEKVFTLFEDCEKNQGDIGKCVQAWENVQISCFSAARLKVELKRKLVEEGLFYAVVKALAEDSYSALAKVQLLLHSKEWGRDYSDDYRSVIVNWLKPISPAPNNKIDQGKLKELAQEGNHLQQLQRKKSAKQKRIPSHQAYESATRQVDKIKEELRKLNISKARKYKGELVAFQQKNNDQKYAAKSLSNIATYALEVYQKAFALECALEAVQLAPSDCYTQTALAEAYIRLSRYSEAEKPLDDAEAFGAVAYAENARVRILGYRGSANEVVAEYEKLLQKYASNDFLWELLVGYAEALKENALYPEAFDIIDRAIKQSPNDGLHKAQYVKASLLQETGRLTEALELYQELRKHNATPEAFYGIGLSYMLMGMYSYAIDAFQEGQKYCQDSYALYMGEAKSLRLIGQQHSAIKIYANLKENFSYDYMSYIENAYAHYELGKISIANKEFVNIEKNKDYDFDVGFFISKANFLKNTRQYEQALQLYSQILQKYPYNDRAKIGQADLFKVYGEYDQAIEIYEKFPDVPYVRNSLAATLLARRNDYAAVLRLTSRAQPLSKTDWISHHIHGMALLRANEIDKALSHFQAGLEKVPFAEQKSYYATALAIAQAKNKQYEDVLSTLDESHDALSNVVKLHAYCWLNRFSEAESAYQNLHENSEDIIVKLRNEIGAQFGLSKKPPQYDAGWIIEQECNAVAIATSEIAA